METFKTHHFILQSGGEQNWGDEQPTTTQNKNYTQNFKTKYDTF